ncbi:chitobiase/beta-hexosaminidase C-terminal domain-containing protein [Hyalangium gracile]|uniref:chitobiase/beta-hexosaminidase C-terminal domain-containing protein n=1 Tax=Hyalangium gracile TaxID=394092 RepID=UPI001CC99B29|nr:chitobiase/beta-hexosaminidase C-terminal domain-containing protein [Hyalangium gracile]
MSFSLPRALRCALALLVLRFATACGSDPSPPPPPTPDEELPTTVAVPGGGAFNTSQRVVLICSDGTGSGCAGTFYTTDGTPPSSSSPRYTDPIAISANTTVRFFSVDASGNREAGKSEQYFIDAAAPVVTASPPGGLHGTERTVTLECVDTGGAGCGAIHYTRDGTVPSAASPEYTVPLTVSETTTLRFFATDKAGNPSPVVTEQYLIDRIAPVSTASPRGGFHGTAFQVTLACADTGGSTCAAIHYTLDGSPPSRTSPVYTAPLTLSASTTVRFFAEDGLGNEEAPKTETYVFDTLAPTVSASPSGGNFFSALTVSLTCGDGEGSGCQAIHFTQDGSAPTLSSPVYAAPLTIATNTLLQFVAVDRVGNVSGVQTQRYVIDSVAPTTVANPAGGTFSSARSVSLRCEDGAGAGCEETYYTVDGSTPTTGSTPYNGALLISSSTTLKFFSVDVLGNAEAVQTQDYVIEGSPVSASAQIAAVRSAQDGALVQRIEQALVTYVKPFTPTDPAGFFLQDEPNGPALFVAVDPATLSPSPLAGDRVSLTVTRKATVSGAVQALSISGFTVSSRGQSVEHLRVDASFVDLPAVLDAHEHELLTVSGFLTGTFSSSGIDHLQAPLATSGTPSSSPSSANLRLRVPSLLQEQFDPGPGCTVTVKAPLWRFSVTAQPSAWTPQDITWTSCPAPRVMGAAPSSGPGVTVRFNRFIDPASVAANGVQFLFSGGLVASSATVLGREVWVATSAQVPDQSYSVTVSSSVRDRLGNALDPGFTTASFPGFRPSAVLRITEVAPNIDFQRDLVELQVVQGGSVANMTVEADTFVLATLPDVQVATGDIIVVHFNPNTAPGTDAPGPELLGKSHYPAGSYASNYDTAWDFHGNATGINLPHRVLRVEDRYGNIQDGVAFAAPDSLLTTSPQFASLVRALQTAGHWQPTHCDGVPCTFTSPTSVLDISASWQGTSSDRSITAGRKDTADTHSALDWTIGPSSLGRYP